MGENIYTTNNGVKVNSEELKPCPFCGGDAELIFIGNDYCKSRKVQIKCKGCRVTIINGAIRFTQEWLVDVSVKAWNKRI